MSILQRCRNVWSICAVKNTHVQTPSIKSVIDVMLSFTQSFCLCLVFRGAVLFAFHTWMHHVQKAHKHSRQPYLLCAQVIAVIFLIQPKLNEKWVGGVIDPWPYLSVPHLFFRKHSGMIAGPKKKHCHHWTDNRHARFLYSLKDVERKFKKLK